MSRSGVARRVRNHRRASDLVGLAVVRGQAVPTPGEPHFEPGHDYCSRTGRVGLWECECDGIRASFTPCGRLDCLQCYERNRRRRGECVIAVDQGDELEGRDDRRMDRVGWVFGVFTLPEALHRRIGWSQLMTLRRAAWRAMADFVAVEWGLEVGGYAVVHPGGDRCSSCGKTGGDHLGRHGRCRYCDAPATWRPHVHVGVPRVGLDADGEIREVPHFLSPAQLRRWWSVWAAVIRAVWSSAGFDASRWLFDVAASGHPCSSWPEYARVNAPEWSYRGAETPQLYHRWRYDRRPWPAWEAAKPHGNRGLAPQWYGLAARRNGVTAAAWRAAVVGSTVEGEGHVCPECGVEYRYKGSVHLGGRNWQYTSTIVVDWLHSWPDHPLVPDKPADRPDPPGPAAAVVDDWATA